MALLEFNWKDMDPVALKAVVSNANKAVEKAIVSPANLDKAGLDLLERALHSAIDAQFANVLIVNADPPATVAEATTFLAGFQGVPQKHQDWVKAHPEVINKLKRFSRAQQEAILMDWDKLLQLLTTFGPIILKIVLFLMGIV